MIVYGCSDDLVEIEGEGLVEEFNTDRIFLTFSDGTRLRVKYEDGGVWKIKVAHAGQQLVHVDPCELGDADTKFYSDVAYFLNDVQWVAARGKTYKKRSA